MNIKFKQIDERHIQIIDVENNQVIGRIFTPSGTNEDKTDGIQICGFQKFVEFWGCRIFGDDKGNATKDIQLLFNSSSKPTNIDIDLGKRVCCRCFYPYSNCQCLEMVKQLNDASDEIKKHYSEDRKRLICEKLEKND